MEYAVAAFFFVPLSVANWLATKLILRDELISHGQRTAQILLVWLVPVIGAVIVFAVHRRPEEPSRKYREAPDPGDDFGFSGRGTRSSHHADGDE